MAEENHEDKNANCTDVQPVTWNQIGLIVRKICSFLGPTDLSCFRLVCKKWKNESTETWEYHRMRHTLIRFNNSAVNYWDEALSTTVHNCLRSTLPPPKPLTVFREYPPPSKDCDFDCVGAEDLRNFFLRAKKDDHWIITQLKNSGFMFLKLRQWNCFGVFPSGEQEGAKWLLNELPDKLMYLTLDSCNLSISQGDFFATLCRLTQLRKLTIRGTYFQLRPSFPVEPKLDEISPLPILMEVEMNYEHCTAKRMPNYNFPWNLFLRAMPKMGILYFSYSNRRNLEFAIQQFSKAIFVANQFTAGEMVFGITFKNLSEENSKDPVILKKDVMNMVSGAMKKLQIRAEVLPQDVVQRYQQNFKNSFPNMDFKPKFDMVAHLQNSIILIYFHKSGGRENKVEDPPSSYLTN